MMMPSTNHIMMPYIQPPITPSQYDACIPISYIQSNRTPPLRPISLLEQIIQRLISFGGSLHPPRAPPPALLSLMVTPILEGALPPCLRAFRTYFMRAVHRWAAVSLRWWRAIESRRLQSSA
eukprot:GHVO01049082.1.p1 GENE.GHVO01049082.1~~GHVO01049082.1.p1  ORF type:complete len:122 (-),score=25.92 GHVO01049082.1:355-720(-)